MRISTPGPHPTPGLNDHGRSQRSTITMGQRLNSNMKNSDKEQVKLIDKLNEQKQALIERRTNYMSNAVKNGVNPKVIKAETDSIDEQIKELEQKIAEQSLEQQRKALGMDEDKKKKEAEKAPTTEDPDKQTPEEQKKAYTTYVMNSIVSAKNDLKKFEPVQTAQNILRTEAKSWEHNDPAKSASLLKKAANLDGKLGDIANKAKEQVTESTQATGKAQAITENTQVAENTQVTQGTQAAVQQVNSKESPSELKNSDKQDPAAKDKEDRSAVGPTVEVKRQSAPPGSHIDKIV
ncbi:hypothetical protein [Paenibacillus tuaregi]|uniref:hypothetical protein n=1 Tax=Paenibacillus tuaregi TaxID=1816681 RepID=UPI000837F800|nr:hypothetical protein [Paenibacillus tuaregi]